MTFELDLVKMKNKNLMLNIQMIFKLDWEINQNPGQDHQLSDRRTTLKKLLKKNQLNGTA